MRIQSSTRCADGDETDVADVAEGCAVPNGVTDRCRRELAEQDEAADEDYCICGLDQHERAKAVRDSLRKAKDGAPEHPAYTAPRGEPVAWRWRAKGASLWVYDPDGEWLKEHKGSIEAEPLFTRPQAGQEDGLVSITHNGSTHVRKESEWLALARADIAAQGGNRG